MLLDIAQMAVPRVRCWPGGRMRARTFAMEFLRVSLAV